MNRENKFGFIIKINFLVVLSVMLLAGSAFSRPILEATATMSFSGTFGSTQGGEFNIQVTDVNNDQFDFIGFCLELDESISPNILYTVDSIADYAENGGTNVSGSGQDYLSAASKWVYWEYITGGFGFRSDDLADNVQRTIWALEEEDDSSFDRGSFMTNSSFYNAHIGNQDIEDTTLFSITGDVYVLNIGEYDDQKVWIHKQSIIVGEPVPEPATMLLFATGLIGLAGVSYRRKKK